MRHSMKAALLTLAVATAATFAQTTPTPPTTRPGTTATVGGDTKRELTEVPVRRVVLFSSGVGFFQHSGRITGNAATELRFKTDQINDILKSLVVSDTSANGGVKSITYGSQNPVAGREGIGENLRGAWDRYQAWSATKFEHAFKID